MGMKYRRELVNDNTTVKVGVSEPENRADLVLLNQ